MCIRDSRQAVRDVQDVVLGDGAGGGGAELVEQVGLLQQQLLEGALAPLDQVLRVERERWRGQGRVVTCWWS